MVIVPGVKQAALGIGGKYGRGFAVCRKSAGASWGPPAAMRMEGGSVGFQIGVSETDVVMLVMDQRSMNGISVEQVHARWCGGSGGGPGRTQQHRANRRDDAGEDSFVFAIAWCVRGRGLDGRDAAAGSR